MGVGVGDRALGLHRRPAPKCPTSPAVQDPTNEERACSQCCHPCSCTQPSPAAAIRPPASEAMTASASRPVRERTCTAYASSDTTMGSLGAAILLRKKTLAAAGSGREGKEATAVGGTDAGCPRASLVPLLLGTTGGRHHAEPSAESAAPCDRSSPKLMQQAAKPHTKMATHT